MKKLTRIFALSSISVAMLSSFSFAYQTDQVQISNVPIEKKIPQVSYQTIIGENKAFIDNNTDEFVLAKSEWSEIQTYVEGALSLPTTEASMRSSFNIPEGTSFINFQALLEEYSNISNTAFYWKTDLYPSVVNLSLSLINFGEIKDYMILPLIDSLNVIKDKSFSSLEEDVQLVEQNRQMAVVYLQALQDFSIKYAGEATDVGKNLLNYSAHLEWQKLKLEELAVTHNEYTCDDGSELQQRIDELYATIKKLNQDYYHNVVVASTAVTYIWLPVVSIPIMAVYGSRAEEIRLRRNELMNEVIEIQNLMSHKQKVSNSYYRSSESIRVIHNKVEDVIPHIDKLKLHWQSMNSDFSSLLFALESAQDSAEIMQDSAFIGAIGTLTNTHIADENWGNIIEKAKAFSNNAYIQKME